MRRVPRMCGVTLIMVLTMLVPDARAAVTVNVTANRTQVYLGESVLLSIEVRGTQQVDPPDLSQIAGATVVARGDRSQNAFSYSMGAGGGPTLQRTFGRDFIFEITPTNVGPFVAGPVIVRSGSEAITTPGPALYVMGVEAQDWVKLAVNASRDSVLVDESFEIEFTVALRQLPAPYGDHDPLNPQDPPRIQAPFLNVAPIDGLARPDLQPMLQGLLVSRDDQPGFGINDYTVRSDPFGSMFNMSPFAAQQTARFQLPRRSVTGPQGTYHVYSIRLTYVAKQEGDYTFGPVELKGQPIVDVAPGGQIVTRPVFAVGQATVVSVIPPPEQGRPPSFIGAIGTNLVASARLDTQTCNVGDPLTLTLDIGGNISLDNLRPPVLSEQEALTQRFRVYDDTVQVHARPGGKLYSYTVRPTQAGTYELPPIAISYYDVRDRTYHTVYTDPLPLRANEAAQVGDSMILSSITNRASQQLTFLAASQAPPVAPITMDPTGAVTVPLFAWPLHGSLALAGPTLFLLAGLAKGARRLQIRRSTSSRPRGARRAAEALLDRAASETDRRRRDASTRAALAVYLGNRLMAPTTGLAPSDVRNLLLAHGGVPAEVIARYVSLYERLFLAEFALAQGTETSADGTVAQARALIHELDAVLSAARPAHRRVPGTEEAS